MLLIIFSFEQRYQVVKGKSKILAAVFNIDIETKKIFYPMEQSASRGNFHLIFFYAGRVVILEPG